MGKNSPVIMIAMDGAEASCIERFCAEGELPALSSLINKGCFGTLEGEADLFAGGVWPTFYTSKKVPWHGIYHNKLWRHENMRCEIADDLWLAERPFWDYLNEADYCTAIIDVPMTIGAPKSRNGIQLCGWGTHDLIKRGSWPSDLWKGLRKKFGSPLTPCELFGPQSFRTLTRLHVDLLRATDQMTDIAEHLWLQKRWDLFFLVYGATHRAGHYLWNLSQMDAHASDKQAVRILQDGLLDIYRACDRGIGRIVQKFSGDAKTIVFSVHGMAQNPGWSDYCGQFLHMIQSGGREPVPKSGFLYRLRQFLPWQFTRSITQFMPKSILDRLVSLWSANMFDWENTRFFPLPMDQAGYIRINLKGREPYGIVEQGAEYEKICDELETALLSFFDVTSGEPVVRKVHRLHEFSPDNAPYRENLPDLVVTWNSVSAIESKGVHSDRFGDFSLDGRLPSGRAGNHTAQGWFVAVGDGISPASSISGHHIMDLVPTVFKILGAPTPASFHGEPIPPICEVKTVR
jgi:predicted AlkP superfamily phosphohydrolase/phosphomutase